MLVALFMIYHVSEQTYRTTFAALLLNVLALAILVVLMIFSTVLKGQVLLVPFELLGAVPAAIAYVIQVVLTRNLCRTKFDQITARFVIKVYSMMFWAFFVLIVALMDAPLVLSFLVSRDSRLMLWWSAGIFPFVLGMYLPWGAEARALRMRIGSSAYKTTPTVVI